MIRELRAQFLPLSLVLHGEQGFLNPSTLQQAEQPPHRGCVADAGGVFNSFHGAN